MKLKYAMLMMPALLAAGCAKTGSDTIDLSNGRLQQKNEPIAIDMAGVQGYSANGISTQGLIGGLIGLTPTLTLRGTVAPPSSAGVTLQASDITVSGSKAYIAYNLAGASAAGAVDVIETGLLGFLTMSSSTVYPSTDINKVYVDSGKLYVAGADANGASLTRVDLDLLGVPTATTMTRSLRSAADPLVPAYAATSIIKVSNYLYATSGSNGGLQILNATDMSDVAFTPIEDARGVSARALTNVYVVTGKTASADAQTQSYALGTGAVVAGTLRTYLGASINQGKSGIYAGTIGHLSTAGEAGTQLTCYDGTNVGTMPTTSVAGLTSEETAANSVAFGNGLVYIAEGGAGVAIYSLEKDLLVLSCSNYNLAYRGRFSLGAGTSANNVYWSGGYLVVATGIGGFKIIEVQQPLLGSLLQIL